MAQEVAPFGVKVTLIEPGYFRTNFLSGSLVTAQAPISAYDGVRAVQAAHAQIDGTQIGDPRQAAVAMVAIAEMDAPPLRQLLGSDALSYARAKVAGLTAEFDQGEPMSLSTDFA